MGRVILPISGGTDLNLIRKTSLISMSRLSRFAKTPRSFREPRSGSYRPDKPTFENYSRPKGPSRADRGIELIYGVQSVIGALSANKRDVYTLWMKTEMSKAVDRYDKEQKQQFNIN